MRHQTIWLAVFVLLAGVLLWLWQRPPAREETRFGPETAAKAKPAVTETPPKPPTDGPRAIGETRPAPEPAAPDQLAEWMDSLVALCLRREKSQARELYTQLVAHKSRLAELAREKYRQVAGSQATSLMEQDAKLTALAYLALLRPQDDFMALLEPLRLVWKQPLADAERKANWEAVEKKYITTTADEALTSADKIFANVVAFVVGEHLRAGDVKSLKYVTGCLASIKPDDEATDLPDPWLSGVLTHCGRELGLSPEPGKRSFESYLKAVADELSYSTRLRHQAKLMIVNEATSVFELLQLIGNSLSGSDAAKAIVDYLQTNEVDTVSWQLIVEGLTARWGAQEASFPLSFAFRSFIRLADINYARTLASIMLESAGSEPDVQLSQFHAKALESLVLSYPGIFKKAHPGQVPPQLLDQMGYSTSEAIRTLVRNTGRGSARTPASYTALCNIIFASGELFVVRLDLLNELLSDAKELSCIVLGCLIHGLSKSNPEDLIAHRPAVMAMLEDMFSRRMKAPAIPPRGQTEAINNPERASAAMAVRCLGSLLKVLSYPPLASACIHRIGQLRQFYLGAPKETKKAPTGGLPQLVQEAEVVVTELIDAGYSLSK